MLLKRLIKLLPLPIGKKYYFSPLSLHKGIFNFLPSPLAEQTLSNYLDLVASTESEAHKEPDDCVKLCQYPRRAERRINQSFHQPSPYFFCIIWICQCCSLLSSTEGLRSKSGPQHHCLLPVTAWTEYLDCLKLSLKSVWMLIKIVCHSYLQKHLPVMVCMERIKTGTKMSAGDEIQSELFSFVE